MNEFYTGRKPPPLPLLSCWNETSKQSIECSQITMIYSSVCVVCVFVPFLGTCPHMENQITHEKKPDILLLLLFFGVFFLSSLVFFWFRSFHRKISRKQIYLLIRTSVHTLTLTICGSIDHGDDDEMAI